MDILVPKATQEDKESYDLVTGNAPWGKKTLTEVSKNWANEDGRKWPIADKGIGIPDEDQQNIFERFYRARNSGNIQGTGLGLHIVKRYLDLLNGEATVESRLGSGTKISIRIPINQN